MTRSGTHPRGRKWERCLDQLAILPTSPCSWPRPDRSSGPTNHAGEVPSNIRAHRDGQHMRMQRLGLLTRRFGFDVLIVVAAIESAIERRRPG